MGIALLVKLSLFGGASAVRLSDDKEHLPVVPAAPVAASVAIAGVSPAKTVSVLPAESSSAVAEVREAKSRAQRSQAAADRSAAMVTAAAAGFKDLGIKFQKLQAWETAQQTGDFTMLQQLERPGVQQRYPGGGPYYYANMRNRRPYGRRFSSLLETSEHEKAAEISHEEQPLGAPVPAAAFAAVASAQQPVLAQPAAAAVVAAPPLGPPPKRLVEVGSPAAQTAKGAGFAILEAAEQLQAAMPVLDPLVAVRVPGDRVSGQSGAYVSGATELQTQPFIDRNSHPVANAL